MILGYHKNQIGFQFRMNFKRCSVTKEKDILLIVGVDQSIISKQL